MLGRNTCCQLILQRKEQATELDFLTYRRSREAIAALVSATFRLPASALRMGRHQSINSYIDLKSITSCGFSKLSMVGNGFGSVAGVASIEIVATLLTVELLDRMSGMEQAVPEVDWLFSVFCSHTLNSKFLFCKQRILQRISHQQSA